MGAENAVKVLRVIVQFLVNFYFHLWFEVKIDSSFIAGPYHKLREIQLIQRMKGKDEKSRKMRDIAKKFIEKGAWHAHSELIISSLVCSEEELDRQFGVSKILSLRDGQEFGSTSVRPFIPPKLNWDARSIRDIQDSRHL